MKRLKTTVSLLALVSMFILSGCGQQDDDKTAALEQKIEKLEQQVSDLESSGKSKTSDDTLDTAASGPVSQDTIDTLTNDVNDAVTKAEETQPTGTTEEKRNQYFELKGKLDEIDRRADDYDDYIESQYKKGILSYDEYRTQEKALNELENKLDAAEDKLEWTFGIDD